MSMSEVTNGQLVADVNAARRALVEARFRHSMGQLENSADLKRLRRDVARLLTEARRRELVDGVSKDALLAGPAAASEAVEASTGADSDEKGGFLKGLVDKISG